MKASFSPRVHWDCPHIQAEQCLTHTCIAVSGELDISNAEDLPEAIAKTEAAGPSLLILDLGGLEFMDSRGLHVVWEAQKRARSEGRRLVLVRPPAPVFRVFEITGMDTRFEFQ